MGALPFTFDEVYHGLATCQELIRNEGDHLAVEYQVEDAIVGVLRSGVKETRIPLANIAGIELRKTWFGLCSDLVLQLDRMEPVENVPGMKQGRLTLAVARADRP